MTSSERNDRVSFHGRVRWHPTRREPLLRMAVTFATGMAGDSALAQERDIPSFQSGRFQFTILSPRQILPSIRLFRLDGKTIELSSLRGRPVLVNFWAPWCEACRMELPILDRLYTENRNTGLQIIAISEDRVGRKPVEQFIEKFKIRNLPIYLDPNGYVAYSDPDNRRNSPFAVYGIPVTYAVAASGWVVGYMSGAADWASEGAKRLIEFLRHS